MITAQKAKKAHTFSNNIR